MGETALVSDDYFVFRGYQLSAELSSLIQQNPLQTSKRLLLYGLRHRRNEVREASKNAIAFQIRHGDFEWVEQLRKSSSQHCQQAYYELVLRNDVPVPENMAGHNKAIKEFALLKRIAQGSEESKPKSLFEELVKMRSPKRIVFFGNALFLTKIGRTNQLLREAKRVSKDRARVLLAGISENISSDDFNLIVSEYEVWNSKEKDRYETPSIYTKASALAAAILRCTSSKKIPRVREVMRTILLTPSSRDIVLTLLKYGDLDDVKLVLDRIAESEHRVDFWNHTELGRSAARRMEEINEGIPQFLKDVQMKEEFWEYIDPENRPDKSDGDLLPLKDRDNRALYVRLAAYAIIGAAREADLQYLMRLNNHYYSLIARTAAVRFVRLMGGKTLSMLSVGIDDVIQSGKSSSLAQALRAAELELYDVARLW